jgi:F-type H+-transporting ATPase subunit epsilon
MATSERLNLQVITPDRTVLSAQAYFAALPGTVGEFGVLPGHAAFCSTLKIGPMRVTVEAGGRPQLLAISGGIAEVKGDEVVVLTPAAERAEEIDIARAEAAARRAEERLAAHAADLNQVRAQAALTRALNRLAVAKRAQP